jgi:multidrug transporter EmrE-like cation transporter
MNIVFTALLGLCFFGQIPDAASAVGFALIVSAAIKMRK